jgi:transposase-like protein
MVTMSTKRRSFSPQFKAKLALEALREERTVSEIASEHQLNPNMVRRWRDELASNASDVFDGVRLAKDKKAKEEALEAERDELLKAVGTATVERDWLYRMYKSINGGQEPPKVGQI